MKLAFGRVVTPHYHLDQCDVIVSLDSDLLGPGPCRSCTQMAGLSAAAKSPPTQAEQAAGGGKRADADRDGRLGEASLRSAAYCRAGPGIGAAFEIAGFSRPELRAQEKMARPRRR